jgi:uncharacterized protein (TIGR03437 family)
MNYKNYKKPAALTILALVTFAFYVRGQSGSITRFAGPTSSQPLALSADDSLLAVANPDNNSVSLFDLRNGANTKVAEITVGKEPNGVAVSPDGTRAYVANTVDGTVSVISIDAANSYQQTGVVATIAVGTEPYGVALGPTGKKLYVTNSRSNSVSVIDTGANQVTKTITGVGYEPRGIAITNLTGDDTAQIVYVTQFLSLPVSGKVDGADDAKAGHVTVIAAATDTVTADVILNPIADTGFKAAGDALKRIPPPATPGPADFKFAVGAYPNQLNNIAIRGQYAFVPNTGASPNGPIRFDVNTASLLSVFNLSTNADAGTTINMHKAVGQQTNPAKRFITQPWAIAFKHQADQAYVVSAASNIAVKLAVDPSAIGNGAATVQSDPTDATRVLEIPTGKNPRGIVIDSADKKAYVMNYVSRDVTVIDLTGQVETVSATLQSAALPNPGTPEDTLQVGKELYNTSVGVFDPATSGGTAITGRMSNNGWGACSACHPFGLSDNVVWIFPSGPKRTIPQHIDFIPGDPSKPRPLNWSAERDEEEDFELNIRAVSGGQGLIVTADGVTQEPAVTNFTPPNAGRRQLKVRGVNAWDAIKAFVASGIRAPISPLAQSAASDADIAAGRQLFIDSNCQNCHGGPQWSTSKIRYTPPPDPSLLLNGQIITELKNVGTFDPNFPNEVRANGAAPLGADGFNPAPLKSIFAFPQTFFHNGSALSLDAVMENVAHRTAGTPGTDKLQDAGQRQKLVKFLLSIDASTTPINPPDAGPLNNLSAASYASGSLAQESIVSAFGTNLATSAQPAKAVPLPVVLSGTTVGVEDAAGVLRLAPLFYAGPGQVNYELPPGLAAGAARVTVFSGTGNTSASTVQIAPIAPGLFTANANGTGVAAAVAIRAAQNGTQTVLNVFQCDSAGKNCTAAPLDLGADTDQVIVSLFGSGIRNRSALSAVTCAIGGASAPVSFAGPQGTFVGLDQVNVTVPNSLRGRGVVDVVLTVDGQTANTVNLAVK